MPSELIAVGRIIRPHGVRGELLLESLTDFPERLEGVDTVYLGEGDAVEPHPLQAVRLHRHQIILRLGDCHNRETAEAYRGQFVQVRMDRLPPLPPGRYYHHQIIGLTVVTDQGELLGAITEILETGANDVYVVAGPGGELLLPALKSVILTVDLDARRMTVRLMEGLR